MFDPLLSAELKNFRRSVLLNTGELRFVALSAPILPPLLRRSCEKLDLEAEIFEGEADTPNADFEFCKLLRALCEMPFSLEPAEYVERFVVGEITDDSPNLSSITFFFPANDEKRGFKNSPFFTPVEVEALNAFFNLAISISFVSKILLGFEDTKEGGALENLLYPPVN